MDTIETKSRPTSCIVRISSQQNSIPNKKGKQKPVCEMHDDEIREMHDDDDPYFFNSNFKQRLHSVHNLQTEQNNK
jgi:hypothetical protein